MPKEDEFDEEDDDTEVEITYTSVRVPTNIRRILNIMAEDLDTDVGTVIEAMLWEVSDATPKSTDEILDEPKPKTREILDVWNNFLNKWTKRLEEAED